MRYISVEQFQETFPTPPKFPSLSREPFYDWYIVFIYINKNSLRLTFWNESIYVIDTVIIVTMIALLSNLLYSSRRIKKKFFLVNVCKQNRNELLPWIVTASWTWACILLEPLINGILVNAHTQTYTQSLITITDEAIEKP